jgi:hypothetical protein
MRSKFSVISTVLAMLAAIVIVVILWPATQASATTTTTFTTTADAFTASDQPTTVHNGSWVSMDNSPLRYSYFKFAVTVPSGDVVTSAVFKCWAGSSNASGAGFRVTTSGWSETTLTWNNAPVPNFGLPASGSTGAVTSGTYAQANVTGSVPGSGIYTFVGKTASDTQWSCMSKENTGNHPAQLIVTSAAAVSHTNTTLPARGAFSYSWYPEAWNQNGVNPATHYNPSLGFYNSVDVMAQHVQSLLYGNFSFDVSSWWGQGTTTDQRLPNLLTAAHGTSLKIAPYYEAEGNTIASVSGSPNPASTQITTDLNYITAHYINDPNYMWVNDKPAIFAFADASDGCGMVDRWVAANAAASTHFYLVLKVFSGYASCTNQPDQWHQYGPASAEDIQGTHSFTISPGYFKYDAATPLLARDATRWATNVNDMNCSSAALKLVTTFNEWGEGTSVESATQWASSSGQGTYLDTLHNNPTCISPGMSVSVVGNHLVDGQGSTLQLRGVNRSGTQYACGEGWGIFDGPVDTAAIAAMKSWGINAVRVNGNEDCWLGINGVPAAYSGVNYQNAIIAFVNRLNSAGMYVIIDLHVSAPGTTKAINVQKPMADRDHSNAYWSGVATAFKNNHAVLFDVFNEPFPDSGNDTTAAWTCVRDGGTCPGVSFTAAGSQEMLNAIRATGATNPVMVGGPGYSGWLDHWTQYKPSDSLNQVVASVHMYGKPLDSPYSDPSTWNGDMGALATTTPVVEGEGVDTDCTHNLSDQFLPWADSHGVSYTLWAWVVSDCAAEPSLITNYSGTPSAYGVGLKNHLAGINPSPSPSPTPTTTSPSPSPTPTTTSPAPSPTPTTTSPSPTPTTTSPSPSPTPTTTSPSPSPTPTSTTPPPPPPSGHKVLTIFEENMSRTEALAGMPHLNGWANQFGQAIGYNDIGHPSLPNYLAVWGGSTFGVTNDCDVSSTCMGTAPSVWGQTIAAGKTAKAYQESMPSNCLTSDSGTYAPRHGPWPYWTSTAERAECNTNDVPLGSLTSGNLLNDINTGNLPITGEITPNLCNDAHDCSLATADNWLNGWIPKLMAGPDYTSGNLTIIVVFDEGSSNHNVAFVVIDPRLLNVGKVVTGAFNHYALTRWLDDNAGVTRLRNAATAGDLRAAFGL